MYSLEQFGKNVSSLSILPPLTLRKKVKDSDKWKKAVMDAFEYIGKEQFLENMKFHDYYRMVDGKMSYLELRQVIPHLETLSETLDGVGIDSNIKHYDLVGSLVRDLVAKLIDSQDKFHIADVGEIAQNEFLRFKDQQIMKSLNDLMEREVKLFLAEKGLTLEGKTFASQEEQQAYIQQIEQAKQESTPKDTKDASNNKFKTVGTTWAEATMEKDKTEFKMHSLSKEEFTDKLLTGRCFRHYKIGYDNYKPVTWSPKNTFFSKEVDAKYAQDCEYVGRWHLMTPKTVIDNFGHRIKTDIQKKILGGNNDWKSFVTYQGLSGTIEQAISSNFNKPMWVPFDDVASYDFYLDIQDEFNVPMGESVWFEKDGTQTRSDRYLPHRNSSRMYQYGHTWAHMLRDDFSHRRDLCTVTEVYFIAQDLYGLLTYKDESGMLVSEEVTEDILEDFIKDNNIKQDFKMSIVDIDREAKKIHEIEENTIKWVLRPVCYEGVKISSPNLDQDLILFCEKSEHQIQGVNEFDIKLPVAGHIGKPWAPKIMPYQVGFNLCMNQIQNLLEKEIGIFFLLDVALIPSDIAGYGDMQDAMIEMRNLAKDIGFLPVATSGDRQKDQNQFNQFTTHNLSFAGQVQYRMSMADKYKMLAYETVGSNPQSALQPTKYETAEGVRIGQEASNAQVAEVFQDFSDYEQSAWEIHLSVAQYCQSNKKDITVTYTKSDASIAFLKLSDPSFPLRKFGIFPSKDGIKRKELETYKQWIFQNNTLGTDELAFAQLLTSDAMVEAIEIVKDANARKQEQAQLDHNRQLELIDRESQNKEKLAQTEHVRKLEITDKNSQAKIIVGQLTAEGRAADKKADTESYQNIEDTARQGLESLKVNSSIEAKNKDLALKEIKQLTDKELAMQELKLKAAELRTKLQLKEKDVMIAGMNKN